MARRLLGKATVAPPPGHTTPTRAVLVMAAAVLVTIALSFGALFGLRALFGLWH